MTPPYPTPTKPTKAIVAAAITAVGTVGTAIGAALSEDGISSDEWGGIAGVLFTGTVAVIAVYQTRNAPKVDPPL